MVTAVTSLIYIIYCAIILFMAEFDPLTGDPIAQGNMSPKSNSPFPCQHCGYGGPAKTDLNSPTALKGLALEALVQIVETAPRNVSLVTAIRELIDRVEGKAPQSIAMTVKKSPESTLSDDQLAALLALLPNAVIIPPMPRRLENE